MSTATLRPTGRLDYPPGNNPGSKPGGSSRASWTLLTRAVTVGVFLLATIGGIVIGVRAPELSPVAPAIIGVAAAQDAADGAIPLAPDPSGVARSVVAAPPVDPAPPTNVAPQANPAPPSNAAPPLNTPNRGGTRGRHP